MGLSIIIVNYKTARILKSCLDSINWSPDSDITEIQVVDNASGDNSREIITSAFPGVHWIQMDYNAGFARANNEGIRQSKGNVVLLLNSDTIIEGNAIKRCYEKFIQSDYIACGVQLLNPDRTPQISGNYVVTGALNYLLPLPYIGRFLKWLGYLVKTKRPSIPEAKSEVEVDWINGAFLMVKKQAIKKAGLMDEDFFLYAEEAEWCSRLRKQGRLCIYGEINIIHLQGETANETFQSSGNGYYNLYDRKGLQIMLSNMVRIRKQLGVGWYLFHLLAYTFTVPVFFIISFIVQCFRLKNPFSEFRKAEKFASNVAILWRYMPVIISGKSYFYKVL